MHAISLSHSSFVYINQSEPLRIKLTHVTSSTFESTSKLFKSFFKMENPVDSSLLILSYEPPPISKTKQKFSFPSSNHHLNHFKDDSSSYDLAKEILESRKTLDLPSSKSSLRLHPKKFSRKRRDPSKTLVLLSLPIFLQ